MAEVCDWNSEGEGEGNVQIRIYLSQIHVKSLSDVMYNGHRGTRIWLNCERTY